MRSAARPKPAPPAECAAALHQVRSLVAVLSQSARAVEQGTGITNAQLFLLRELHAGDELTINELAERTMTGQNTVSAVVTRLQSHGLVRRGRSSTDGRIVTVSLTAAGRRLLAKAPEPATTRLLDVLCDLAPAELDLVTRALSLLNDKLNAPTDGAAELLFENTRSRRSGRT